jgi:uncharacterized membrane protein
MSYLTSKSALVVAGALTSSLCIVLTTQAQDSVSKAQSDALNIVTLLTQQQDPYYQKNKKFNTDVKGIAKTSSLTLSDSFNYGIRTGFDAAYVYVMPAQTPMADQLKSYIGAAFVNPKQKSEVLTIICENAKTGRLRPSDPKLVMTEQTATLTCGDSSVPVPITGAKK